MAFLTLGFSLGGSSSPAPAAPSDLTVSIAEASLAFGDTATASVGVSGYPPPALEYQWTLDAVDVDGQTNATFEGVPVGALRVRVTATNSEGSAGPTTSAPVTVAALAPDAFSAGQWTLDANGVSGQLAVTLLGLPPSNGAAITSVERAASTLRQTWTSTFGAEDYSPLIEQVAPFGVSHSPWGMFDKPTGSLTSSVLYGGLSGGKVIVQSDSLPMGSFGLPAGAPFWMLGAHYNTATTVNPFMVSTDRGLRSDNITDLTIATTWTDRSTDVDRSSLFAWQIYGSVAQTNGESWASESNFFDIQVRPSAAARYNFPDLTGTVNTDTIDGVSWRWNREINSNVSSGNTRAYGFEPASATLTEVDLKPIIDFVVANEVALAAQSDAWIWIYGVQAWVEPRLGSVDVAMTDFAVTLSGVEYVTLPTWVALAGITLDTAYTITGLLDGEVTDAALRAVNSIGNGPESDAKTDTPFAPAVPETVGDNEWTFQPVESSTDLEAFLALTLGFTGFSLAVDGGSAVEVTYTALEAGPVALALPTISGTPALGATMTAGTGRWASLTGVTSYAYQWERDGTPIGGATSATYDLVEADASTDLTVVVTATDTAGSTASESAATAIPAFFPDLFSTTTGTLKNTLEDDPHNAGWTLNSNMSRAALTPVGTSVGPTRVAVTASPVFAKGIFISIGNLETGVPVRVACIVQPASGGKCYLLLETSGGSTIAGFYTTNFTSVTTTGSGATGAAVTDVGGGYYRMEMTYTPGSTQAAQIKIGPAGGTVGDAVDVYLGGVANVS